MEQISTHHNILRKAYNELNILEIIDVDAELASNETLNEDYNQLLTIKELLDSAQVSPNPTSIQLIMEASKSAEKLEAY